MRNIKYSKVKCISGKTIYHLFKNVGWIAPKKFKPISHQKIDGISNHTIYMDSENESNFLKLTFENSTSIYVAKNGTKIVGIVRVISDLYQRSIIYDLVVDPDFQKIGIGKCLVEKCIREYAHTQITLGTASSTMKFYEKFGFIQSQNYLEIATESY